MIASVSGRRTWTVVPTPCSEVMTTSPPRLADRVRTASMPTPRPEMSLVCSAVEKPALEEQLDRAGHVDRSRRRRPAISPRSAALRGDPGRVDAAAVVADGDDDVAAGVAGGELEHAGRRLARGLALVGRLEPVVERVAHQVDERVAEGVDDGAVELGVAAGQDEVDLLADLGGQVAHEAREAHEDGVDLDHPHLHDHRLQRLRAAGEVTDRLGEAVRCPSPAASDSTRVRCTTSSPM